MNHNPCPGWHWRCFHFTPSTWFFPGMHWFIPSCRPELDCQLFTEVICFCSVFSSWVLFPENSTSSGLPEPLALSLQIKGTAGLHLCSPCLCVSCKLSPGSEQGNHCPSLLDIQCFVNCHLIRVAFFSSFRQDYEVRPCFSILVRNTHPNISFLKIKTSAW